MPPRKLPQSLREIESRYAGSAVPVPPSILARLRKDPRAGARKLYLKLKKRSEHDRQEHNRLDGMLHFERVLWKAGLRHVAGVDEVGIGPMAGPVVAAAVVFPAGVWIDGIDDSKRLDAEIRESLEGRIREAALGVGMGVVEAEEIDRLNIYHAGLEAMRRAIENLPHPPEHVLVDSRTIPGLTQPQNSFHKGDGINFSIAAASIVAKVHRDRLMVEVDRLYPGYGFARHKGYCTPAHQEAIRTLGPCPIHRRSFNFIRELRGEYGELFYALKKEAEAARSRGDLDAWEDRLRRVRDQLTPSESRKLHLVAGRRWKSMTSSKAR